MGEQRTMANYDFSELEKQYESFDYPMAVIKVNDKEISTKKRSFILSDIIVDLTSGYEASTAEFSILDVYDMSQACFQFEDVKKFIFLEKFSVISIFCIFLEFITTLSLALLTSTSKDSKISHNASVSVNSGTLQIVTSSSERIAAGINATQEFFAPLILIVPDNS